MRGRGGPWSCAALAVGLLALSGARLDAADARSLYQIGARAQASEDWPVAVEQYRAALAANPAYLEAAVGLAETLLALEQYEEASRWATRARALDPGNPDLAVLEGRIRLGAGEVTAARVLFNEVLKAWPNNLEARFGLAEADVAEGRVRSALDRYGAALAIAPQSRRGLLSLAILSESTGDTAAANRFIEDALRSHAGDVAVQLAASDLYAGRGRWDLAERHARAALAIQPESAAARRALATTQIALKRFDEAAGVLREVVAVDRGDAQAWYALGLAYARSGDHAKALTAFGSAITAAPDDETARIVQEYTAIDALKAEDPQRAKLAAFHRDAGRELENRSMLDKALAEYRRSLLLEPASRDGRIGYARVNRAMGFSDKQLSELKVLVGLGVKDTAVLDEVEGLEAELDGTVSRLWGVDQYAIERLRHLVAVSTIGGTSPLRHPLAAGDLARAFRDTLTRYDSLAVTGDSVSVTGFDSAFRSAGLSGADYFLVLGMEESERTFSASATLYLARTGASVASFSAFRTGNDRVRDVFLRIGQLVADALPARGTLIARRYDRGLVDLGSRHGMKAGTQLAIVKKGRVRLAVDAPGTAWDDADIIGDFTVTGVDEAVSEGTIKRRGTFDFVNIGDEVVLPRAAASAPTPAPAAARPGLLARLRALFGR
jgi:tetratricopeptide (TPR) repeat protein